MNIEDSGTGARGPDCLITDAIVSFAGKLSIADIPLHVREIAKLHLLDAVGVALAAASMRDLTDLATSLSALTAGGDTLAPGMRHRLAVRDAALVFGMLVHGLEFDDTSVLGRLHPSAFCAPSALTLGARRNASGKAVLAAYIAGIETAIRLGAAARGGISEIGFDPTGVVGALGASVVSAMLLDLDALQIRRALAFACSLASGNMEYLSNLASTKRLNAGIAAANGITAAVLASTKLAVPEAPFDGKFGFYPLYARGASAKPDLALAAERFGEQWHLADDLAFKPLPLCFFSIPAADAAISLARKHEIEPSRIASIMVRIPKAAIPVVAEPEAPRRRPPHRYAAQFSIYFAVACAFARRRVSLDELAPHVLNDAGIEQLIDKISCEVDVETTFPSFYSAEVVVAMKSGERYAHREAIHRGSPKSPYTRESVIEKFEDNALRSLAPLQMERLKSTLLAIEELDDVKGLEEMYAPDATS